MLAKLVGASSVALLISVQLACQSDRPSPGHAGSPTGRADGTHATSAGGSGGTEGGAPGDSASVGGASASSTATDAGGAGGAAGAAGMLGAAGTEADPTPDSDCASDRAFAALSGGFVDPTPRQLALALNESIFGEVPLSFILNADDLEATVQVSYTVSDAGLHSWPEERQPAAAPAFFEGSVFGSSSPQERGWMLVHPESGPLEVPLSNVRVTATTEPGCAAGTATVVAVVSAESSAVLDAIAPGASTDGGGGRGGSGADVTLRAVFSFELVPFEFGGEP